jgi:hypothetical protein
MPANWRQLRCYRDTCTIIGVTRQKNTDGKGTPGPETYSVLARGVLYHHQTTANISDATAIGRTTRANLLTKEIGHFVIDNVPPDGALLRNTTIGSPLNGKIYRVLGPEQAIPNRGVRRANKAIFLLRELERPPTGLPT